MFHRGQVAFALVEFHKTCSLFDMGERKNERSSAVSCARIARSRRRKRHLTAAGDGPLRRGRGRENAGLVLNRLPWGSIKIFLINREEQNNGKREI